MQRLRQWIQFIFTLLTNGYWGFLGSGSLYQGPLKVLCSPGLNCYSCPASTTFCPIGSLQQLLLGVRMSFAAGQLFIGTYVVGAVGLLAASFGRFICGWACPFGWLQEWLHRIPSPTVSLPSWLGWCRYFVLVVTVVLLPLLLLNDFDMGLPWFCKFLCPAGTLEAGISMLVLDSSLRSSIGWLFVNKLILLTLTLIASVLISRPFCRVLCPLGAFYGLFNRISLIRLKFAADKCTKCGACHRVCPVEIRVDEAPNSHACIRCLRCLHECRYGALGLDIAGYPVHVGAPTFSAEELHNHGTDP
ncbi:4Fe-4S binding protein [Desulfobulbus rhabdoformis]|uniref:4Fe-4S binding protein n=1 Tax=Desulfobulbus rhabdoformis TaxID=34032 RepID=UPI001965C844|nr:4Fe-4S binding protein [Desulfobulbus rhabdoformis]MBM9615043.1 4Fe-4S binding protein [Desulfobulbus rhabdoformis]